MNCGVTIQHAGKFRQFFARVNFFLLESAKTHSALAWAMNQQREVLSELGELLRLPAARQTIWFSVQ
jgi:hypothetical protein